MNHTRNVQNAEVWTFIMGAGVISSPFLFQFNDGSMLLNSVISGGIVCLIAAIRTYFPSKAEWLSWLNLLVGLWLFLSPFVLTYTSWVATWGAIVVGLIIAFTEFYSAGETHAMATR